jgi:signal transduction histidine kinase
VRVELERHAGAAALRVVDNGAGVSARMRRKLFEPFQTGKPNGVGIGLALSRKIARAHGGDLVLETPTVGASFLLTLPVEAR